MVFTDGCTYSGCHQNSDYVSQKRFQLLMKYFILKLRIFKIANYTDLVFEPYGKQTFNNELVLLTYLATNFRKRQY